METNTILTGDSLEVLKTLPDNSIDCIVTDPPYGYSFMGKDWDKAVPKVEVWQECLRVLKPGGFAFIMSSPRQDVLSHMIVNLDKAGFETGFTSLYWTYASGFPKASNIGKMVDKREGAEREVIGKREEFIKRQNKTNDSRSIAYGDYTSNEQIGIITSPATPQAKALDGSYAGYQPKPAVEIILVCMKPLEEKTYVDQAMKNGKGITWLDDVRVPYESEDDEKENVRTNRSNKEGYSIWGNVKSKPEDLTLSPQGRFPANLLVSDDVLNDGRILGNGKKTVSFHRPSRNNCMSGDNLGHTTISNLGDSGSFSRYFDLDKWAQKTFPFFIVPKASKSEKNMGLDDFEEKSVKGRDEGQDKMNVPYKQSVTPTKNQHPTVKPLKLMQYLITLGSRENDIILDPFIGSGTTAIAVRQLSRKFIGIELNEEYIEIANNRLKPYLEQSKLMEVES